MTLRICFKLMFNPTQRELDANTLCITIVQDFKVFSLAISTYIIFQTRRVSQCHSHWTTSSYCGLTSFTLSFACHSGHLASNSRYLTEGKNPDRYKIKVDKREGSVSHVLSNIAEVYMICRSKVHLCPSRWWGAIAPLIPCRLKLLVTKISLSLYIYILDIQYMTKNLPYLQSPQIFISESPCASPKQRNWHNQLSQKVARKQ